MGHHLDTSPTPLFFRIFEAIAGSFGGSLLGPALICFFVFIYGAKLFES